MRISEILTPKAIAAQYTEVAANRIPYLGAGLFPNAKKMGLDLALIKAHKGLNVKLAPANFDAKATLRARGNLSVERSEMAFFREAMLVSEHDQQEIMRVQEAGDPYAMDILRRIYDDANTLIDAANMVPEIMRMQLLCPTTGSPKINVAGRDGVVYSYNYDPNGEYQQNNFVQVTIGWNNSATAAPLDDIRAAQDQIEGTQGTRPSVAIMNRTTFGKFAATQQVRNAILAQNVTANIYMADAIVKNVLRDTLGITVLLYDKVYANENGTTEKFYKDDFVTLLPAGAVGKTWYGTTPEERGGKNVAIVNTGVAVSVIDYENPVNTETVVSEIVLPSYERMAETCVIKVSAAQGS